MIKKLLLHWETIAIFATGICLALLLARNPFSSRTLIPNFEPFPDSFYYIVPARSFLAGHGLQMYRLTRGFVPAVPPLYSFALMPLFLVHNDPRMFYYMNVVLAFISFALFVAISKQIMRQASVRVLLYFLYVTNFYITSYPQWVMAENLTLPLLLLSVYLLIRPTGKWGAVLAAVLPLTFYATKFAHAPLTIVVFLLFLLKYGLSAFRKKGKNVVEKKTFLVFIIASVLIALSYTFVDYKLSGRNVYKTAWELASVYFRDGSQRINGSDSSQANTGSGWFSVGYLPNHLQHHFNALAGGSEQVLFDTKPLLPKPLAVAGLFGLVVGIFVKRHRRLACSIVSLITAEVIFMSTFYAVDMRYIMFAIPFLIFGVGISLEMLKEHYFAKKETQFLIIVTLIMLVYAATIAVNVKSRIMLNLKYAETPWWYLSVQELNSFVDTLPPSEKKPVVVSAIPPYLVDFYSNGKYSLLPLDPVQDFHEHFEITWGDQDYASLPALYTKKLDEGYSVYVEQYGLGNVQSRHDAFNGLSTYFKIEEKQTGCYNLCNIYELTKK